MNWQKKLAKLFSLIFLGIVLASCDGNYCVEADEFDNDYVQVKANPIDDGVFGTVYDHTDGGQTATWHETGLRANGKPFLIEVSGAWIPWFGSLMTDTKLASINRCGFCAKKHNVDTENCICYNGQTPTAELKPDKTPLTDAKNKVIDCSIPANQNDPTLCTCTTLNGKVTDEGVFHFPLNFYDKNHVIKFPDDQGSACKYDGGLGLYLGLFGVSDNETPIRVYHLFSEATTCPINRNTNGECKDSDGIDQTKYVFRSANNRIFVKDDLSGNNGTNANIDDDILHKPNEFIKLIIYDRYYSDNYGQYNVTFLQGVSRDGDSGLLEFLVSILENALLGEIDADGVRQGGVLKFMYTAIVQDSYFGACLQICLSLYIAFFGFATLLGIIEITKKELLSRLVKLSLVIFFTSPTSWYWYNQLVVTFFKDGMDSIIAMFSGYVTDNLDPDNPILTSQAVSDSPGDSASRFSYIDTMIKTMLSDSVTKKIWGLFFESFFGFIYIAAIYALIGFFIYVMLLAAMVYMVTLLKLIFVLALGPIFIAFSLFEQTNSMFKNWLGFIGARSLEMVILFLVLYTFVMVIDQKFEAILHYRVCTHSVNFGLFSFKILLADTGGRGIVDWFIMLFTLAALIYILMEISKKIPDLSGQLISIGGVGNNDDGVGNNSSAMKMAGVMLNTAGGLAAKAAKFGLTEGGGNAFRALRAGARASGISGVVDAIGNKIPVRGIRTRLRDNIIDSAIAKGENAARAAGLKPGTKEFEAKVRNFAMNDETSGVLAFQHKNKKKAALYDFSAETINKRLDTKLVKEPLKTFLKDKAKEIKKGNPSKIPLGKDMEERLKAEARSWADKSLSGGANAINGHLKDMKGLIHKKSKLSDSDAAKKFAGNDDMKNKFLQYKQERAFEKGKKASDRTGKNFMRKVGYEENRSNNWLDAVGFNTGKGLNPLNRIGWMDKLMKRGSLNEKTRAAMENVAANYLKNGGAEDDKARLKMAHAAKVSGAEGSFYARQLDKKLAKDLKDVDAKEVMFRTALIDKINKDISLKTEAEKEAMRAKALSDVDDMKKKQLAALAQQGLTHVQNNGGIAAATQGLTNFDGDSLLEAQARAKALGVLDADGVGSSKATASTSNSPVEFGIAKLSDAIGLQQSDFGLQQANFGLEVGNPFLVASEQKNAVNQTLLDMRSAMKSSAEFAAKSKSYDLQVKEGEVTKLEFELKAADPDKKAAIEARINAAKADVSSLSREVKDAERQVQTLESDIATIKKATS